MYGGNKLDDVVLQAKQVDAALSASTSTAGAHTPLVRSSVNAGSAKRSSAGGSAGDPKRPRSECPTALVEVRKELKMCSHCGDPVRNHKGAYGTKCNNRPQGYKPATQDEVPLVRTMEVTLAKGKARAS